MSYYFNTILKDISFDEAVEKVTKELKNYGFGVLTEIDVKATLKQKIDVNFRQYKILGACNPHFAYKALLAEPKIGVFLPCNVIVEENKEYDIEVSAVDPYASMMAVKNRDLKCIADEIQEKMESFISEL